MNEIKKKKNGVESINNRMVQVKELICEVEGRTWEIIYHRGTDLKKRKK